MTIFYACQIREKTKNKCLKLALKSSIKFQKQFNTIHVKKQILPVIQILMEAPSILINIKSKISTILNLKNYRFKKIKIVDLEVGQRSDRLPAIYQRPYCLMYFSTKFNKKLVINWVLKKGNSINLLIKFNR